MLLALVADVACDVMQGRDHLVAVFTVLSVCNSAAAIIPAGTAWIVRCEFAACKESKIVRDFANRTLHLLNVSYKILKEGSQKFQTSQAPSIWEASTSSPRLLLFPLPMVTELRAAMVNGRTLSDGWTAEVVFAAGARSGSVAAASVTTGFTSATWVAPDTACASTLPLPSPRLHNRKIFDRGQNVSMLDSSIPVTASLPYDGGVGVGGSLVGSIIAAPPVSENLNQS